MLSTYQIAAGVFAVCLIILMMGGMSSSTTATSTTPALPAGIVEGMYYRCTGDTAIYKIEGGVKRHVANSTVYNALGKPVFSEVSCDTLYSVGNGMAITSI